MKKFLSVLLALALVFTAVSPALAAGAQSFPDVKPSDWFSSAVSYVSAKGLMGDTGNGTFNPKGLMSRAQTVTVLHSMEGKPAPAGSGSFSDVKPGAWYYNPVHWASEQGIAGGTGNGKFSPNGNITRQDLALMLYTFAKYKGYDLTPDGNLSAFSDQGKISNYAKTALQWAVGKKIIGGADGKIMPKNTASRAEVAVMLRSFCENAASGGDTPTPTPVPEETPTPEPTQAPTPEPGDTPAPEETPTPEPGDTPAPEETPTPEPGDTPAPEETPTPEPVETPTPEPVETPTPEPGDTPAPEETPTPQPPVTSGPKVPVVGYEYGPMTVTRYYPSSGNYWMSNQISSLVFTKVEMTNIGKYKVSVSMQGIVDNSTAEVMVNFYDKDGRVLDEVWCVKTVEENQPYNILIEKFIDVDVLDNAESMAFFSYTGHPAQGGNVPPIPDETPTPDDTPPPAETPTPAPSQTPDPAASKPMQLAQYIQDNGEESDDGDKYISYEYEGNSGMTYGGRIVYDASENQLLFMNIALSDSGVASVGMFYDLEPPAVHNPVFFTVEVTGLELGMAANIDPQTYTPNTVLAFEQIDGPDVDAETLAASGELANSSTKMSLIAWNQRLTGAGFSMADFGFVNFGF